MNNIFDDYQEEMAENVSNAISNLLNVIRESSNTELVAQNKYLEERVTVLSEENKKLSEAVSAMSTEKKDIEKQLQLNTLALYVLHNIELTVKTNSQIEKFFDCLFVPTFEKVRLWDNTPLWISVLTRYYKNRTLALSLLRHFKWCKTIPENVDDFRLPLDWPEQELECWLNHMSHNYVCNNRLYNWDNLEWWAPFALMDISKFYSTHKGEYSEVPFQYVFMNPYMKTDKFLTKLGLEISNRHSELIEGIKMLDLNESQRALVVKSSLQRFENDYPISEASEDYRRWLWDNLDVILDRDIIRQLYNKYCNEYTSFNDIVKLPSAYIVEYITKYPRKVGEFLSSKQITDQAKKFILESLEKLYDTGENI